MLWKNHPKNPANQPFQHPSKKQKEDKEKREKE